MNSKLRDTIWQLIKNTRREAAERQGDDIERLTFETDKAEKAIRKAVAEEMLELVDIDYEAEYLKNEPCDVCGDMQYSHAPDTHKEAGVREFKAELRRKIKSWVGDGDE